MSLPPVSSICAVIPAHDEEAAVAEVVRGALAFVAEAIVVDDGSSDGSAEEARRAGARVLRWPRRLGKGAALRAGLEDGFSRGFSAAVTLDADGQHLPREIPRLLEAFRAGADLVLGDRSAELHRMPFARRAANTAMTWLLRHAAHPDLRDSQCGFRLISARLFHRLRLTTGRFETESELLIQAHRLGFEPIHVPVSVVRAAGRSKIRPIRDALRFLALLARARTGAFPLP